MSPVSLASHSQGGFQLGVPSALMYDENQCSAHQARRPSCVPVAGLGEEEAKGVKHSPPLLSRVCLSDFLFLHSRFHGETDPRFK